MASFLQHELHPIHWVTIEESGFTSIDGTLFGLPQFESDSERAELSIYGKITCVPTEHRLAP